MKVIFLPSSDGDVRWFNKYYRSVFPEGSGKAKSRMSDVLAALKASPHIGQRIPGKAVYRFPIVRTPFSLIYRVADGRIEILRLWDDRANPNATEPES